MRGSVWDRKIVQVKEEKSQLWTRKTIKNVVYKHWCKKQSINYMNYDIVGYNTEALNIVQDTGRGVLLFIKIDIY